MGVNKIREELGILVYLLADPVLSKGSVIKWASPVISFGNIASSRIATLGINPSSREFIDDSGKELVGEKQRFHTLKSLGLARWSDAKEKDISMILESCQEYFNRNPYDRWFKRLDYIISGTSMSYYFPSAEACHLDLIPYATNPKWADLTTDQRVFLLELAGDSLGLLLKKSSIALLVLNGQTVIDNLERIANIKLERKRMPSWTLYREQDNVNGYSYSGVIDNIAGVYLEREIKVLGYNYNIQSSFGITNQVQKAIRNWITKQSEDIFE
jgi:hypothetical protein